MINDTRRLRSGVVGHHEGCGEACGRGWRKRHVDGATGPDGQGRPTGVGASGDGKVARVGAGDADAGDVQRCR